MPKIRLFCPGPLQIDQTVELAEKNAHYLLNVMKLSCGDKLWLFDNQNGEFEAEIVEATKKKCRLKLITQSQEFFQSPDLWLLFAPLKKDKTDFVIEKACELGVRKICPTLTARTNSEKVRLERLTAQTIEACEQCRRVDLPEIQSPLPLPKLLQNWPKERILFLMDESGKGTPIAQAFAACCGKKAAILVGPEGGFAPQEFELLQKYDFVKSISLGPRILRAETAAAAALSCWQALCGDWKD